MISLDFIPLLNPSRTTIILSVKHQHLSYSHSTDHHMKETVGHVYWHAKERIKRIVL